MAEINTIITLRQGTTADWANSTVILKSGEMGLEYLTDGTVKIKAGDGEHYWSGLSYIGSDVKDANVFQVELGANDIDDIAAIEAKVAAEGAEKQNGDVAIVKATIAEGKYSYTSYVYDNELDTDDENSTHGWNAMDGNYSASNVFLKNGITLAGDYTSIGNYNKGDTIAAGSSLESVLSGLLQQEILPGDTGYEIDLPSASISVSGGSGEVGSSYTLPTATLTITDVGSYPFAPTETGIVFNIGDVTLSGGGSTAVSNTTSFGKDSKLTLQASDTSTLYTDSKKSYTFSGTAAYQASTVTPKSNLGNEVPGKKIAAGSVTITSQTANFSGYRYSFAGGTTAATIDSAAIRALTKKKKSSDAVVTAKGDSGIVFTAAKGDTKVIFAYPSSWTTKTPKFELFTMSWGDTSGFEKSTVQVADARGGENGLKEYTVYTYTPATPFAADETKYSAHFE